ncbi:MAG TPA: NAD(P)-dependent alcohol dehydrogenase [Pirellulales bacterium]|jgi:NADPH:quinone reductase-like Zn-dependent oxidoreductase|nr:NAD(P)-dependent alcohol dehydrogenase [Pirellulales bacterium]
MQAYEIESFGFDGIRRVERPDPAPSHGEALLKMRAWSLNYRDLMVAKGAYNPKLRMPATPLSDGVGEVVAVGPGVSRVKVGDRVAATFMTKWLAGELNEDMGRSALGGGGPAGMLAEMVVLNEEALVQVPQHLSDEQAAALPCAAVTAWHALVGEGRLKSGDTVLVQGTGGVSIFALQIALLGGARVIITSSRDDKLARALAMGASDGINYRSTPEWDKRVRELTGGIGVDYVVEVGGAGTLAQSMKAVKAGGQISLIGVLSGGTGQVNPLPILMRNIRVQGIFVGSREMFENMNRSIALHKMQPVVDRVFPFADAVEAYRYMETGSHFGKVAIRA